MLLANPKTLEEATYLARVHEHRFDELRGGLNRSGYTPFTLNPTQANTPSIQTGFQSPNTTQINKHLKQPPLLPTPTLPIKRLSPAEIQLKRDKGLCYNCHEKYSLGHKCKSKFFVLLGTDDLEEAEEEEAVLKTAELETGALEGDISCLNSLIGVNDPRTLRVVGKYGEQKLQVLIDNGATHNFIKPATVEKLRLPVTNSTNFKVYIGNGDYLQSQYKSTEVPLNLQGHEFSVDLFVLPIKGPDIVLGVQWLQQLGEVMHNYKDQVMRFQWEGNTIQLFGESQIQSTPVSFQQFQALWTSAALEDASWVNFDGYCKQYSEFHLEDNVSFTGEGNDKPTPIALPLNQAQAQAITHLFQEASTDLSKREQTESGARLQQTKLQARG